MNEQERAYQLQRVKKQLRRAAVAVEERRARRLELRRQNGQRPYVDGRQPCPLHPRCVIVFYSNNSLRHQAAYAVGGAR